MPCEEVIDMISDEERLRFESDRFTWLCCPFGSLDIEEALRFGLDFGYHGNEIFTLVEQYSHDTATPFEELDIVYIVYEHILQHARDRIYEATGYDFVNDGPAEIYTYGNFAGTCYDYTEEAKERLLAGLAALDHEKREELLDDYLLQFLEYIDIAQVDIEKEAESLHMLYIHKKILESESERYKINKWNL